MTSASTEVIKHVSESSESSDKLDPPETVLTSNETDSAPTKPIVSFATTTISSELRQYLIEHVECFRAEEKDLEALEFFRCVDHRSIPNHIYYEGYYHGLTHSKTEEFLHPRMGVSWAKTAAPVTLRAFAEAVRRKNSSWIDHLAELLAAGKLTVRRP